MSARVALLAALALVATATATSCAGRLGSARLRTRPNPGLSHAPAGGTQGEGEDGADPGAPVVEDSGVPPDAEEEYALAADEGKGGAPELPALFGDLEEIQSRGVLRVLIHGGQEDYLPRAGLPATYDRQLARELATRHHLKLQFVLVDAFDQMIPMLLAGKGDVLAANFTVTPSRAAKVDFTRPVAVVKEMLVGRKGAPDLPDGASELAGREVHVRPSSPFAETLANPGGQAKGVKLVPAPETLDQEELSYQVGRGERPFTVLDSNTLQAVQAYNDQLQPLFALAEGRQKAWAVRKGSERLRAALDAFLVEKALTVHTEERFTGDLDGIRRRGVLRVLTRNNPVTYYLYQGEQLGFDYQMARMLADALHVRLEMVVPPSRDLLVPWLKEGRGDVIAASYTVTPERGREVSFSTPYLNVDELLVQRRAGPRLTSVEDLAGKRIHVRRSSSYYETLKALKPLLGDFEIVEEPEDVETEELIDRVGRGEIPFTVADSHILAVELIYRRDVEGAFPLVSGAGERPRRSIKVGEEGQKAIAFALRPENPELRAFADAFVRRTYRGLEYNVARKRYFETRQQVSRAAQLLQDGEGGKISPYDDVFRKYASRYELDWRLMAAQSFQESRFDPHAQSWVGALGLFQVMPQTGRELGFRELSEPEPGVHAGVKYMSRLIAQFDPQLPFRQRVRFALAAYNAGLGHVQDARRLAQEKGLDPNRWFENVERAMLLLEKPQYYQRARFGYCRGSEPVKYVSQIQNRYDNYVKLFPQ
ncbi:MAG TPA: transporter substrate-binding domain-containing protein [Myxococcaceae bacterium]|jgi:membrane-bound lytic murein transglycosylase F